MNWAELGPTILEFIKQHGLLVTFFLALAIYLLWRIDAKDKQLLKSKDAEIERLVTYKNELQEILLNELKVERLSSTSKKEDE